MKIAVTYENGEVFQHFGHTENFKIYTITNNRFIGIVLLKLKIFQKRIFQHKKHRLYYSATNL